MVSFGRFPNSRLCSVAFAEFPFAQTNLRKLPSARYAHPTTWPESLMPDFGGDQRFFTYPYINFNATDSALP
jgi:hypothetical protein